MSETERIAGIQEDNRLFGERLRSWREAQKMSHADIADLLGTQPKVVRAWEAGERQCRSPHKPQLLALMRGEVAPGALVEPPPEIEVEREIVEKSKFTISSVALAKLLGLPSDAEIEVKDCQGEVIALPLTVHGDVYRSATSTKG